MVLGALFWPHLVEARAGAHSGGLGLSLARAMSPRQGSEAAGEERCFSCFLLFCGVLWFLWIFVGVFVFFFCVFVDFFWGLCGLLWFFCGFLWGFSCFVFGGGLFGGRWPKEKVEDFSRNS